MWNISIVPLFKLNLCFLFVSLEMQLHYNKIIKKGDLWGGLKGINDKG